MRRGAWYQVVEDAGEDWVILDVHDVEIRVTREHLVFRKQQPQAWSVVRPAPDDPEIPGALREPHFVCPVCHTRYHLVDGIPELRCLECDRTYPVDWGDEA